MLGWSSSRPIASWSSSYGPSRPCLPVSTVPIAMAFPIGKNLEHLSDRCCLVLPSAGFRPNDYYLPLWAPPLQTRSRRQRFVWLSSRFPYGYLNKRWTIPQGSRFKILGHMLFRAFTHPGPMSFAHSRSPVVIHSKFQLSEAVVSYLSPIPSDGPTRKTTAVSSIQAVYS